MLITLLSDFGNKDNAVAIAKGLLLKVNPSARLIDLSHEVAPYNLLQCSYLLMSAYKNFPAHTFHVSMFDIMHQAPARLLLAKHSDQFILTADNGLLSYSFPDEELEVYQYNKTADTYLEWLALASEWIRELSENNYEVQESNAHRFTSQKEVAPIQPVVKEKQVECHVIHIDRFGNVVLNLSQKRFEELRAGRDFTIRIPRSAAINKFSKNYNDVPEGERLGLFNSAGYLEIAIREGSAAQLLGLELFKKDQLIYNVVHIDFL